MGQNYGRLSVRLVRFVLHDGDGFQARSRGNAYTDGDWPESSSDIFGYGSGVAARLGVPTLSATVAVIASARGIDARDHGQADGTGRTFSTLPSTATS